LVEIVELKTLLAGLTALDHAAPLSFIVSVA
jgi:hypothetical protein